MYSDLSEKKSEKTMADYMAHSPAVGTIAVQWAVAEGGLDDIGSPEATDTAILMIDQSTIAGAVVQIVILEAMHRGTVMAVMRTDCLTAVCVRPVLQASLPVVAD